MDADVYIREGCKAKRWRGLEKRNNRKEWRKSKNTDDRDFIAAFNIILQPHLSIETTETLFNIRWECWILIKIRMKNRSCQHFMIFADTFSKKIQIDLKQPRKYPLNLPSVHLKIE